MNVVAEKSVIKRVMQKRISAGEILLYAALPLLLVACGAMPIVALYILPFALVLLYLLYRRFGPYLPLFCVILYGGLSLSLNYDILSVVYFTSLFFAFCGVVAAMQASHYLARAAIAAILAVVGAFVGVGIVRGAENEPVGDIAAHYVMREMSTPVISYLSRDYYDGQKPTAGVVKLTPDDNGYDLAAAKSLADWAKDEFDIYIWYKCLHYGAAIAMLGFFAATAINGKTVSPYDSVAEETAVKNSTLALGGIRRSCRIADMRLPRAYLWTMALPATVTGLLLSLVGGYDALSATVMHAFATLPAAFGCYTLLAYFASLFKGKARVAAHIVLIVVGVSAVVFPLALFILSVFGVCDSILNLRFWTEFIRD